jgi:hypothetical protein
MKAATLAFFLILSFKLVSAQELDQESQQYVSDFISWIKDGNLDKLKAHTRYPLRRENPVPNVKDPAEFAKRYAQIFDDSLKALIVASNIERDWSRVGDKGIMLNSGLVWLSIEGQLIAVNYQSRDEAAYHDNLMEKNRSNLYESLRAYKRPATLIRTSKFRVRIDEMNDQTYRYAAWSGTTPMSEKPDLVLENGRWIPDGSGGNHHYEFVRGVYKYVCSIVPLSENDIPAYLTVYKNGEVILNQPAEILEP